MSEKEIKDLHLEVKFPKYWCHSINYGVGGIVHTYTEIRNNEQYNRIAEERQALPPAWRGFITDDFIQAEYYAND